jgi:Fur family transcriptional regulator, ferric uptake regulator
MLAARRQSIEADLRRRGFRLTRPRRAVLDALLHSERHLTAAQLHALAQPSCPTLSLASVYRTLALLESLSHVQHIHGQDGCQSYAAAPAHHSHQLVCSYCGTICAFTECDLAALVAEIEARTGFCIQEHILELIGLCPDCRK